MSDAIAIAVVAGNRVLREKRGGALQDAIRHFRSVLNAMPDGAYGPVSADDVRQLEQLSDAVIDHIEECLRLASWADTRKLIDAVYQIRALFEQTARDKLHHRATVRLT